jgi:hypothetical protein
VITRRRAALAAGSPCIILLVGTLLWNAWEYRAELVTYIRDRTRF